MTYNSQGCEIRSFIAGKQVNRRTGHQINAAPTRNPADGHSGAVIKDESRTVKPEEAEINQPATVTAGVNAIKKFQT